MKHDFYVVVWSLTMMAFGAALHDSFIKNCGHANHAGAALTEAREVMAIVGGE